MERIEPLPPGWERKGRRARRCDYRPEAWGDAMDSFALVEEQIKAGPKLLDRLNRAGIPVVAAAWVKPTERFQWYLYLVTPLVGEDGAVRPAYRRINPVVREVEGEGTGIAS